MLNSGLHTPISPTDVFFEGVFDSVFFTLSRTSQIMRRDSGIENFSNIVD